MSKSDIDKAMRLLEEGRFQVLRWEDDDISLRFAAEQARLPFDRLTNQEAGCFPDVLGSTASCQLYLFIRNKILQMWFLDPNVELTANDAQQQMIVPYNSDTRLIYRIHAYLQRYGYINIGLFHRLRNTPSYSPKFRKKVIIIGGGISGLIAARQLVYFGFDILLLEAKKSCGGRTLTYKISQDNRVDYADLGASIMHSIKGNPVGILMRQADCKPYAISRECPLFDEFGKNVESSNERLVADAFKKIIDLNNYMQHQKNLTKPGGEPFNLEETCVSLLDILELKMQNRRKEFYDIYEDLLIKLENVQAEVLSYTKLLDELLAQVKMPDNPVDEQARMVYEIETRCRNRDLADGLKKLEGAIERQNNLEATLRDLKRQEPSDCFMNNKDRKTMNFHMAVYEGKYGASLDKLSAKHYNQSDLNYGDTHSVGFKEGFGSVMAKLLIGMKEHIRTDSEVTEVNYTEDKVTVRVKSSDKEETYVEEADCVLCCVPLGVLKKVAYDVPEAIKFIPPLPEDNIEAITKVGSGALNKIVMVFDRCFWNTETQFFGHLNRQTHDRGEMYMFCSTPGSLVLTALMSGHSATVVVPNHVLLKQCLTVLQRIFGVNSPQPLECVITRWNEDPNIKGAFSYLPPGVDESFLDRLGTSVHSVGPDGIRTKDAKIFFGGEHTCKEFHGTVQGAWISGLREAAKIADKYLGCPFSCKSVNTVIDLDSDEESEI
ncbi:unnamed protein product [Auanema sp. JU1783]|nr:unnamed protein product [Auanema sp. JU1783]